MRIKSPFLSLSVLLLFSFSFALLPSSVAAQGDEKEKAQKEEETRHELERKTLAMLDEIAGQALSLKLPENRSLVLTNAADLLWTHDEKRARNLFWDALNTLTAPNGAAEDGSAAKDGATKEPKPNESPAKESTNKRLSNENAKALNEYYASFQLRQEFLRKVARRDPQLALDMLRAARLSPPAQTFANYHLPDETDLEQEIANEAAARDPKRALQIARESLAKGFTFQVMGLLSNLSQRSPEAASEFAGDLIDKLQTANLGTDMAAWWTAIDILRLSRTPHDGPNQNPAGPGPNRLKLNEDRRRELVEIVTDAALGISANPNFVSSITEVMPEIEQFVPDRVEKVKMKLAEVNRSRPYALSGGGNYPALVQGGTPEEILRAAAGANNDGRETLFQAAVANAVMHGKADAFRELIKSEVSDQSQRNRLNDLLDAQQIGWDVNHGDTESLQKLLPSIRLKEKRAEAMAQIAMLLEKKGEHDEALKLLDEAQALVKIDLQSQTQSDALLAVLLADSLVDPARAFAATEPIVDRANDQVGKLMLLDKLIKSGFVKDGEIILQHSGIISLDFAIFKYGQGIVALAKADFNRTKALADRLQRNELRIMARLLMVQALLHNNDKPTMNDGQ